MIPRPDFKEDARYVYAVARIRVLEKRLLSKHQCMRLLAEEPESLLRSLSELGLAVDPSVPLEVLNFDALLSQELVQAYQVLDELSQDPDVTDWLKLRYDLGNLKASLKQRLQGPQAHDSLLINIGTVPASALHREVLSDNLRALPPVLRQAAEQALLAFERGQQPREIDLVVEKTVYEHILTQVAQSGNSFVDTYLKSYIDLINLKTCLRVKSLGESSVFLRQVLIESGFIDTRTLLASYEEPPDALLARYEHGPYGELLRTGLEAWTRHGSLAAFEKLGEDYLIQYLQYAQCVSFGIEPLVAYILAKENELKNLRILLVGKVNNLPHSVINERLRATYPNC